MTLIQASERPSSVAGPPAKTSCRAKPRWRPGQLQTFGSACPYSNHLGLLNSLRNNSSALAIPSSVRPTDLFLLVDRIADVAFRMKTIESIPVVAFQAEAPELVVTAGQMEQRQNSFVDLIGVNFHNGVPQPYKDRIPIVPSSKSTVTNKLAAVDGTALWRHWGVYHDPSNGVLGRPTRRNKQIRTCPAEPILIAVGAVGDKQFGPPRCLGLHSVSVYRSLPTQKPSLHRRTLRAFTCCGGSARR